MEWFDMWCDDREAIIVTMHRNLTADLNAGYNPRGLCAMRQKALIEQYEKEYDEQLREFAKMTDKQTDRWCYFDLLARGVITR